MKTFSKNQFRLPCPGLLVALVVLISFPYIHAYSASSSENYYYQAQPPTVSHHYSQNHTHIVNVVGAVYCHNRTHIEGVTVKVTCMTSDKNIEAYGRTNIHGKYNITIEAYGIDTCMAKVHIIPEGSPCKMPTDFDAVIESPDYYILAVQWPYGVCSSVAAKRCITPIPLNFTIHGLWPQEKRKTWSRFDIKKLKDIRDDLNMKWPDLFLKSQSDANVGFWKYEWEKHGVYSVLNQLDFFKQTLKLYDDLGNLLKKLQGKNISPDTSKQYKLSDITKALKKLNLNRPQYVCNNRSLDSDMPKQLMELRFKYSSTFEPTENFGSRNCTYQKVRDPSILFPVSLPVREGNDEPAALLKMNLSSPHRKIGVFAE